ncbi:4Fe-4S binding protein [Acidiplasma sp.]|uniref:4Fe-4S binding protein n=1 Tax=Acidiplasma sp. TaxID=1872114 RepID=UPI003163D9D8
MNSLTFTLGIITIVVMVAYVSAVFAYVLKNKFTISFLKLASIGIFTAMMASMLNALTFYITTTRSLLNTATAFVIGMALMTQPLVATFIGVIHGGLSRKGLTRAIGVSFTGLIIWNEVSMGIFLYYLFNPIIIHFDYYHIFYSLSFVYALSYGINTIYFLVPMTVEMAVLYFVYKPKGMHKYAAISIFTMDLVSPTILGNNDFVFIGGVLEMAIMIIFMVIFLEYIASHRLLMPKKDAYHIKMIFIDYLFMGIGTFLGTIMLKPFGLVWIFYAMGIIFGMWYYYHSMFLENINKALPENKEKIPRKVRAAKPRNLIFFVLLSSFIIEFLMAASMDFATYDYVPFYRFIDTVPVYSGVSVTSVYVHIVLREFISPFVPATTGVSNFLVLYDMAGGVYKFTPVSIFIEIFYIIGYITESPPFLIIMGLEMGALVISRIRKLADRGKKINLAFALTAFAIYTVAGPNFLNPIWYNKLPLWLSTGYEAALYPYLVLPLIGSYVLYAFLALLFGRRSYCSTLCPAAVMYGGSLGQAMVKYNYESKLSKKESGKYFSNTVLSIASMSWILAILASLFSYYYTSTGRLFFSIYGIDPSVFYSYFMWDILWYIFFISIPFTGMSPCRKYGWCSTGTLAGVFSVLGFFKLKVKDKNICKNCTTRDCASSCEVGLSTMPDDFIENGYFKSVKCVGAGDCIRACPYNNIYFYDVRNFVREKLKIANKHESSSGAMSEMKQQNIITKK